MNTKTRVSPSTRTHYSEYSLWQHTPQRIKCHSAKQDMLSRSDYAERVVAIVAHKNMLAINLCLLNALYWCTLLYQHRQKQQEHHNHTNFILCFIHLFLMTPNRIFPQLFHTENASLNF